jgi:hypothetical protein
MRKPHKWSFLYPHLTVTTQTPYSTGTITVVSGVVTIATGTAPSWAASGELLVNGFEYSVNTRDSGSQVTLDDLTVSVSAGTTYSFVRSTYSMPDDYGGLVGPLIYSPGQGVSEPRVEFINESRLREMKGSYSSSGVPRYAALMPTTFAAATGQRHELTLYPTPNAQYYLKARYQIGVDVVTTDANFFVGGTPHGQTLIAAVLRAATQRLAPESFVKWDAEFMSCLEASVHFDREASTPERLGMGRDGGMAPECDEDGVIYHSSYPTITFDL